MTEPAIHIHAPPTVKWFSENRAEKWCFGCRRRTIHDEVVVEDLSLWYDPTVLWCCQRCHDDCTDFGSGHSTPITGIVSEEEARKLVTEAISKVAGRSERR